MGEMKLSVAEIKSLMDQMAKTGLGKLELEDGGFRLKLNARSSQVVLQTGAGEAVSLPVAAAEAPAALQTEPAAEGNVVTSPIVGTFYSAPAPDKAPFVSVGQPVKKGDTIFIVESMKLMNEVQSDFDGEVAEILVEDGAPVEFGQPVMIIRYG